MLIAVQQMTWVSHQRFVNYQAAHRVCAFCKRCIGDARERRAQVEAQPVGRLCDDLRVADTLCQPSGRAVRMIAQGR